MGDVAPDSALSDGYGPSSGPPGRTIGVEEEFLLVDPVSRRSVPRSASVLERLTGAFPSAPDATVKPELLSSQVEAATGVCTGLDVLRDHLMVGRRLLGDAARAEGVRLVSSGTPVLTGPVGSTHGERFAEIMRVHAGQATDYQACGCHVHVGVPDRETTVAVVNHLRPWLPTLLALSANSPYDRGQDSGYASWRMMEQARFPGAGVPPWCGSTQEYDARVERLVEAGALIDSAMSFWLARLSPQWPTVEVRAADAVGSAAETVLQAALTRGLVMRALEDLARGREAPRGDDQVLATALWSAARYGLDGPAVDPVDARRLPVRMAVGRLLDHTAPALESTFDLDTVREALAKLWRAGSGAHRQRAASSHGLPAVVDLLIEQTAPSPAPRRATVNDEAVNRNAR
ncbi:glutamate--cysteine ligase [Streptomyces sp. NPDC051776]|uniref:carboxylate-amine ligase n=1 Tax=Streptomyces sp. NPDC051776 TaxID=3155414 RepID=UPI00343678B8